MMIIPMPMMTGGGGLSPKSALSMLIMANLVLLVSLIIAIYLFTQDSYPGNFWEWSWDMDYSLKDYGRTLKEIDTSAVFAWMYFWVPLFFINGIATLVWGSEKIESLLERWGK